MLGTVKSDETSLEQMRVKCLFFSKYSFHVDIKRKTNSS